MGLLTILKRQITLERPTDGLMDPYIIFDGVSGLADNLSFEPDTGSGNGIVYPFPILIDLETTFTLEKFRWFDGTGSAEFKIFAGSTPYNMTQIADIIQSKYNVYDQVISTLTNIRFVRILLVSGPNRFPSEFQVWATQTGANPVLPGIDPITYPITWNTRGINGQPGGNDPVKMGVGFSNVRFFFNKDYVHKLVGGVRKVRYDNSYSGGVNNAKLQAFKDNGLTANFCMQFSPLDFLNKNSTTHDPDYKPLNAYNSDPTLPASYSEIAKTDKWDAIYLGNGSRPSSDIPLDFVAEFGHTQPNIANLNVAGSIEIWNEPTKTWQGLYGYYKPEEYAAMLSTRYDGHGGLLGDVGVKAGDPNLKVVMGGAVTIDIDYIKAIAYWAQYNRTDGKFPADVINVHQYFRTSSIGISPEDFGLYQKLRDLVLYRNQYLKNIPVWLSETGYDTNSSRQKAPVIGPYDQESVQGIWGIRTFLQADHAGVDKIFFYTFADEYGETSSSTNEYGLSGIVTSEATGQIYKKSYWYITEFNKLFKGTTFKAKTYVPGTFHQYTYQSAEGNLLVFYVSPTSNNTIISNQVIPLPTGTWSSAKKITFNGYGTAVQSYVSNTANATSDISEVPVAFLYTASTATPDPTPPPTPVPDPVTPNSIATKILNIFKNAAKQLLFNQAVQSILKDLNELISLKEDNLGTPLSNGMSLLGNADKTRYWGRPNSLKTFNIICDGSATKYTINHALGTSNLGITLKDNTTGFYQTVRAKAVTDNSIEFDLSDIEFSTGYTYTVTLVCDIPSGTTHDNKNVADKTEMLAQAIGKRPIRFKVANTQDLDSPFYEWYPDDGFYVIAAEKVDL